MGRLFTFGVGTGGRLGHGDAEIRLVPKRVAGPLLAKRIVGVSMGLAHTAAVADDGSVFTWGAAAPSGSWATDDSLTPRKVPFIPPPALLLYAVGSRPSPGDDDTINHLITP